MNKKIYFGNLGIGKCTDCQETWFWLQVENSRDSTQINYDVIANCTCVDKLQHTTTPKVKKIIYYKSGDITVTCLGCDGDNWEYPIKSNDIKIL